MQDITEKEKNELANDCGYSQERYTDKVKSGVRHELEMQTQDEIAIIRKLLAHLLADYSDLKLFVKGEGMSGEAITDFIIYNANVEQIKVKAKEEKINHGA